VVFRCGAGVARVAGQRRRTEKLVLDIHGDISRGVGRVVEEHLALDGPGGTVDVLLIQRTRDQHGSRERRGPTAGLESRT
jgi:hypothetical protein